MKIQELLEQLRLFQEDLVAHRALLRKEQKPASISVDNTGQLEKQARELATKLGQLRSYLNRFRPQGWSMEGPAGRWDALEGAVSISSTILKAQSLNTVIPAIDQIIGQLQAMPLDDEVPSDIAAPLRSGASIATVMHAYLDHLHARIRNGCAQLFLDGHYTQAVEEAVKVVLQHVRDKTDDRGGLPTDGAKLVEAVFSTANPVLSFGDMTDVSVRNEQLGFMKMVTGFSIGVRNPRSHTQGKKDDPQVAFEHLVVASLFCRRIDQADRI